MAKPKGTLNRPADPMQLAKLVGDIATGQIQDKEPEPVSADEVRRVMSALGKMGGTKGGEARAKSLSKKRRSEIASQAAKARWKKSK